MVCLSLLYCVRAGRIYQGLNFHFKAQSEFRAVLKLSKGKTGNIDKSNNNDKNYYGGNNNDDGFTNDNNIDCTDDNKNKNYNNDSNYY